MLSIFSDMVEKTLEVFMDDFIVYGKSFNNCLSNVEQVLERFIEKQLVLYWEKCHFMVTKGIVLGHIVSKKRIKVNKPKIELISKLSTPTTVKDVRSFLEHAGFYRKFIQNFSAIAKPLCNLLLKDALFVWDKKCEKSIHQAQALSHNHPNYANSRLEFAIRTHMRRKRLCHGGGPWPKKRQEAQSHLLC
ncbi:hypothetical protein LguiA_013251 [Lonicera macranthoides]